MLLHLLVVLGPDDHIPINQDGLRNKSATERYTERNMFQAQVKDLDMLKSIVIV